MHLLLGRGVTPSYRHPNYSIQKTWIDSMDPLETEEGGGPGRRMHLLLGRDVILPPP